MYWGKCYVKVPKSLIVCTVANKHQFDMVILRLAVEKLGGLKLDISNGNNSDLQVFWNNIRYNNMLLKQFTQNHITSMWDLNQELTKANRLQQLFI